MRNNVEKRKIMLNNEPIWIVEGVKLRNVLLKYPHLIG
jgi:hypothetical protein